MNFALVMLRRFWFASIRRQVMLSFAAVSVLVMLLFGYGILEQERDFLRKQGVEYAQGLAHTVAVSSASWVVANDVVGLQEVLASVGRSRSLRYALVLSPEGRVLASSQPENVGLYVSDALSRRLFDATAPKPLVLLDSTAMIDVAEPVLVGNRLVGWVRIGFGRDEMAANLRKVEMAGYLMMAVSIVATLLVAQALSGRVTGRLQQLVDVANQIHAGRRDARAKVSGSDEVSALADNFNTMLNELEKTERGLAARGNALSRANADLTRFAEISAHHLMEPSRRLSSYSQNLRERIDAISDLREDREVRDSIEYIERDAARLRNLVRDIQLYLAASEPRGAVCEEDANAVVAALARRLSSRLAEQGAVIECGSLPPAVLDKPRLNDLFAVLVDNALIHARPLDPAQPLHIRIDGERGEGLSRYRIADNGPGIPAEYRERVFEIFERLTVGGEGGSGIGLSIARRIVESRHGRIWIEQGEQGGAEVVLELPDRKSAE
ncbi:MAG TPA: ATP-binding protein [Gallionella sp.]|nr:ATP-binding protein [Gallionella sp.]